MNRREFLGLAAAGSLRLPRSSGELPEPRLADSIDRLRPRYGVVIVGSGYGGAILAARLASVASVCVLERGREWVPGEFPDTFADVVQELRTPDHPLGLYDYHPNEDVDILVGCGLGGTSLINANVVLQPAPELFDHPRWPDEIRQDRDRGLLDVFYGRVRDMLQVERYPGEPVLRKIAAHASSTRARGARFGTPDLAVNLTRFADQPNPWGIGQRLCTLCGDCVTGCNKRAKNTLDMNYLPLAKQRGAHIFPQVEVNRVTRSHHDGYVVHYTQQPADGQPSREGAVRARVVVLAAGALGSPEILLRSRHDGLVVSDHVGQAFSGNADFLGLAYNTDRRTDILGCGGVEDAGRQLRVGPTVVSVADYRQSELSAQFIIEEGAIPTALVDALRYLAPVLSRAGEDTDAGPLDTLLEGLRIARDLAGYSTHGALNHSMIYLGTGHDGADGTLVLGPTGRVQLVWKNVRDREIFRVIDLEMEGHTAALGGTYVRMTGQSAGKLVSVHPIGGCIMGVDGDSGVVDHRGRVFDPSSGPTATHAGLFVADGSILPTSVGVNPLLTIAALSERIAAFVLQDAESAGLPHG